MKRSTRSKLKKAQLASGTEYYYSRKPFNADKTSSRTIKVKTASPKRKKKKAA